jgi:ribosomal protein S18 acetylase RimI-like enzyme
MSAAAIASGTAAAVRAGAGDLAPLAALHRACLPDSILSALGDAGVRRYYAFALGSPHEHVLVVREGAPGGEQAVAGCVLSTAPGTMLVRFARHAPAALVRELAGALARSGRLRRRIGARLAEAVAARPPSAPALPEVTQIFTDPALRGRGLGAILLRGAEAALRQAGHRAYCIHTLRDDNDAGIRFYRREGFSAIGTTRSFGDPYLVMTKELT